MSASFGAMRGISLVEMAVAGRLTDGFKASAFSRAMDCSRRALALRRFASCESVRYICDRDWGDMYYAPSDFWCRW
jgi:hypothetical protein